jgi:formate hydrogenlyase transcriptional activator
VAHLADGIATPQRKADRRDSDQSMTALEEYHWPGNIRELRNVIERAMILAHGPTLNIKFGHTTL